MKVGVKMLFVEKLLYPFNQRVILAQQFNYIFKIWKDNNFINTDKLGDINYLLKDAYHKNNCTINKTQWENYYFNSGNIRKNKIIDGDKNIFNLNNYFGRTKDDLLDLSQEFKQILIKLNIQLSDEVIFSLIYYYIVDVSFIILSFDIKCLSFLNSMYNQQNIYYKLTDGITSTTYSIDIIGYKNDIEFIAFRCKLNGNIPKIEKEKNEIYTQLNDINVKCIQYKDII